MRHQLWRIKWIKWFWKRCRDNLGRYREHFLAVGTELLGDFFDELKFYSPSISDWFCYEIAKSDDLSCRELSHITRKGLQHSIVPIFVNVEICQLMQLLSLSEDALWLKLLINQRKSSYHVSMYLIQGLIKVRLGFSGFLSVFCNFTTRILHFCWLSINFNLDHILEFHLYHS